MAQSDRESVSSGMSLPESDDVDWFDKNRNGKGSIDGRSSAAESEREADKRAVHFSRSGTGPIKRLTSHSAVIDSYSHGMVLVTGLQLRSLEKSTKIFKDGDFVCYEADLNAPGAIYKYIAKSAIWKENNSSNGIGVVYGIRSGYAFLKCQFGSAFLPGSAIHENINGVADLTQILNEGDEIRFTAVPQPDRGGCRMKVLAADLPSMVVKGVPKFAEFDSDETDGGQLAIGLVTDVYQHHGFLWSKPYGSVFFSLAHAMTSVKDLTNWTRCGDRVIFHAYPQEYKNNCNTRAVRVSKLKNCRFRFWSDPHITNTPAHLTKSNSNSNSGDVKNEKNGELNKVPVKTTTTTPATPASVNSSSTSKSIVEPPVNSSMQVSVGTNRLARTVAVTATNWQNKSTTEEVHSNSDVNDLLGDNNNSIWSTQFPTEPETAELITVGADPNRVGLIGQQLNVDTNSTKTSTDVFSYSLWSEPPVNPVGVIGDHWNSPTVTSPTPGITTPSPLMDNIPTANSLMVRSEGSGKEFEKELIGVITKSLIFDNDIRQIYCQRYPEVICCVAISQFQQLMGTGEDQPKILLARLFADKEGRKILATHRYALLICEVYAFYYHSQMKPSGKEGEMAKVVMKILMQDKDIRRIIATDGALTELMCQSFAQMI